MSPALAFDDSVTVPAAWSGSLPFPLPPFKRSSADDSIMWSGELSAKLYKIDAWGTPYFSVNSSGNISVRPFGTGSLPHQEIDLMKVLGKAKDDLNLQLPLLVRFPDILKNRLHSLQSAFDLAIQSNAYDSHYQGVYPVKCNQDRYVVEDIVEFGSSFRFGLEVGSKPELLLAMSCLSRGGNPGAFLVCNGYKDEEYVSLALTARTLGLSTVIVLEQEEELDTVIEASRRLGIRPVIGFRARLRTKHSGHFGSTSGEKGKFGLNTGQIISLVEKLKAYGMLDCLHLLHFHIGSQIPTTALLADGVGEAAMIYCELVRLGASMGVIDIGGGLGIDYDGSKSGGSDMSVEYGLKEYASTVVRAVRYACNRKKVQHPIICSESGRALVSHHSILVFEAVSSTASSETAQICSNLANLEALPDDLRSDYRNMVAAVVGGDYDSCGLIYADQLKKRCVEQFKDGAVGLEHLAAVDELCDLASREMGASDPTRAYNVNLSVFTSMPDYWAIGQLFPVIPIHRLNEKPTVKGVLSDLTCDSDGKLNKFIGGKESLPLHEMGPKGSGGYYLGMFLGGAYQEALGGMHNLFGGPSVIRVSQSDGPHCFAVTSAAAGASSADVLRTMQYEPELMYDALRGRVEEYGGDSYAACRQLATAFNNMPYLISIIDDGVEWDLNG
ncbi:putative arginine decarboxylase 1 [Iris pallida]|uniref:Arginine decarboxylase n=1 Tax=Iris pallida TaxID=29817 RepID=A0AAX6EQ64_IRIPA|nr:putative arginine decarboxylase 1 [Iris pallida]